MKPALFTFSIFAAALLATSASAQDKCGPLQVFNKLQMTRTSDGVSLVPITINGTAKNLALSTGDFWSALSQSTVDDLKLPLHQGKIRYTGRVSTQQAAIAKSLEIGVLKGAELDFPVAPYKGNDGYFGLDYLAKFDADIDFGTDVYQMVSDEHCPGKVVYWSAPAVGITPITLWNSQVTVIVELDGVKIRAVVDTGSAETVLMSDVAQRRFDLTLGSADTPEIPDSGKDASDRNYSHTFKTLTFQGVTVGNPHISIIPPRIRQIDREKVTGSLARREGDFLDIPQLYIGMNVLRKLHVYFAFKEGKMYVTPASGTNTAGATPTP